MPGKHHLRGFKIAPKKIGSPLRGSWTMVSIALVDARKTSLTGVQNSKKIGSPLRGSWTMVSIALVDARKTSLMGVQNSKKIGSPLRGSWTMLRIVVGSNPPPPLGKKLDPPLHTVDIPTRSYDIEDINDVIQIGVKSNGDEANEEFYVKILANPNTMKGNIKNRQ